MKITITVLEGEYIGNGSGAKAPVKSWRKCPANFDLAAKAAAHYAKRDGVSYAIVKGSKYGNPLYRIILPNNLDTVILTSGRYHIAITRPDGSVWGAAAILESGME